MTDLRRLAEAVLDAALLTDIADMALGEVTTASDYGRYHRNFREHFAARLARAIDAAPRPDIIDASRLGLAMDRALPPLRGETVACTHGVNDQRYWPLEAAPSDWAADVAALYAGHSPTCPGTTGMPGDGWCCEEQARRRT